MSGFIEDLLVEHLGSQFNLHTRHLNTQMVKVLQTIGFDRQYVRAVGPHLFDAQGKRYLDLLSGFGVFALGRNHPIVNAALQETLNLELPNLVQMDVSLLAGILGERLVQTAPPGLTKVFFANSGTETVEGALKLVRYATGRQRILYCEHAFHGLTMGALSLNDADVFREGFGPLLPDCDRIPFNDLSALEQALAHDDVAALFVEPIQGKGVHLPDADYLREAARLCRRHGTLFVADEVQTGLGRTGRMWAIEHFDAEPDLLLTAKALSGGQVPVGAILCRPKVFNAVFNRMDRAVVHGSTFAKNNLAMAAGLATLKVLQEDKLIEHAASMGEQIMADLSPLLADYEMFTDIRGKGLMIALEFSRPRSLKLRTNWTILEKANPSLFSQMLLIPLFQKHQILAQVAGHGVPIIKLLPPLVIDEADRQWLVSALREVIAASHTSRALWQLGATLAKQTLFKRR